MNLYRSFATVGGLTLVSRVLGFLRDILIASVVGTGWVADAFFVAFKLPNLFRRLFAEGAFNSAFVPLFAKALEADGRAAAKQFSREAMSGLFWLLLVLTVVAELAMPAFVQMLAPGFAASPEKFELTVLLTRICFPYLICMALVAQLSGVLNSLRHYWAAAAAPILLNIVMPAALIIATLLGYDGSAGAGIVLAWGVAVAGVAQLAMLAFAAYREGMLTLPRLPVLTPGVRRLVALGIPGLVSGGVTQINIMIGTIVASLQAGAVSYLYYADRLYQLPLGIVGVAIGVVLLPEIARNVRAGRDDIVQHNQNRSIEFALLLTLPASIALAVMPVQIIRVLFERGAFASEATLATAYALAAFAIGLPAFVLNKVFSPAFFAREDTRTPMLFATVNLVVNAVGSVALFYLFTSLGLMPHVGIAVATTVAGWINTLQLWWTLRRRGHYRADQRLARNLPLVLLASGLMGIALAATGTLVDPMTMPSAGLLIQLVALAGVVTIGFLVFFAAVTAFGVITPAELASTLRRRGRQPPSTSGD